MSKRRDYHFRSIESRGPYSRRFKYFVEYPNDLNTSRAEGYVEPILELLPKFLDPEIAEVCADLVQDHREAAYLSGSERANAEILRAHARRLVGVAAFADISRADAEAAPCRTNGAPLFTWTGWSFHS